MGTNTPLSKISLIGFYRDYFGFYFVELEVATLDSEGMPNRQLIVGVKIPPAPENVSDMSILKQPIHSTMDSSILDQVRDQNWAIFRRYMADGKYKRKRINPEYVCIELACSGNSILNPCIVQVLSH
jgi:hypothetical protein